MSEKVIRVYGDPVLRRKAREVRNFDRQILRIVKSMFVTMYEAKGVGLAAPQVGLSQRIIVVDTQEKRSVRLVVVNPRIVSHSIDDMEASKEGCLSVPELEGQVTRPKRILVAGFLPDGSETAFEAEGLLARVIQHEVDHLNGVLFIDRVQGIEREMMESTLERIARNQGNP